MFLKHRLELLTRLDAANLQRVFRFTKNFLKYFRFNRHFSCVLLKAALIARFLVNFAVFFNLARWELLPMSEIFCKFAS